MAAPLLAVALCLSAAAPASAAGDRNETATNAGQSDALRVVSTAQSELDTDTDSDPDRRLVDRESSERVDAVVIALWTIAVAMTVLLAIFLWHTSPRRRMRLAGNGSAELSEEADGDSESAEDGSEESEGDSESAEGRGLRILGRTLSLPRMSLRSRGRPVSLPGGDAQPEFGGESEVKSEEPGSSEQDGKERSV